MHHLSLDRSHPHARQRRHHPIFQPDTRREQHLVCAQDHSAVRALNRQFDLPAHRLDSGHTAVRQHHDTECAARRFECREQLPRVNLVVRLDEQPANGPWRDIRLNPPKLAPGQPCGREAAIVLDRAEVVELNLVVAMARDPERALVAISAGQPTGSLDIRHEPGIAAQAVELQLDQGRRRDFHL